MTNSEPVRNPPTSVPEAPLPDHVLARIEALESRARQLEAERDALREGADRELRAELMALRESEERYRTLFESIDQGFCTVQVLFDDRDRPVDYRFVEVNSAFEAQTGLEGALGRTMRSLRPTHEEHWFELYGEVARTGKPIRFENPAAALGRWYDVHAFRIGEPDQRMVAILFDDITERKRAEAQREALESRLASDLAAMNRLHALSTRLVETTELARMLNEILESTITLQSADFGNVQLYDPETKSLSIVAQRGFGREFLDHFSRVDAADDGACGRALRRRERIIIEDVQADPGFEPHRAVAARAGFRAVQSTPMFGRDGQPRGMLSTHFRRPHRPSERDLRLTDLYMRLATELIDRKRDEEALREAKRTAERASDAKSQFLAVMSHELRTPLTAVIGLADLLNTEVPGPINPRQKEYLSRITAGAWHLVTLIDQILTFSRSEAGMEEVRFADEDVSAIVGEVVASMDGEAHARALALRLHGAEEPAACVTDGEKVRQIITNLVGNALKYTDEGVVDVELDASEEKIEVRVSDTGPGIPAERLEEVFEPFVQVDSSNTRTRGGTGLGLAISRKLAELIGAEITLRSSLGHGCTFTLGLPRQGPGAR